MNILIGHGPNLNLLGTRKTEIYGSKSLLNLNSAIAKYGKLKKLKLKFIQTNHEGRLIDFLHKNRKWAHGIVLNPGAWTHYSYALRDAIEAIEIPTVEVHLSDIHNREEFRKTSVISPVCVEQISGFGFDSYLKGIDILLEKARK